MIAIFLVDVPIERMGRDDHGANLRSIAHELFRVSPVVRGVLWNLVIYGLATLLAVWSFQGYWEAMGVPLWTFGYIWAGYNGVVALTGRVAHRIEERIGTLWSHRLIAWLPVAGYASMALIYGQEGRSGVWLSLAVAAGLAFQFGRGLTQVILKDELNQRVPPRMRATANSVSTLGVRLGFVFLGPLLGALVDAHGHSVAFHSAAAKLYALFAIVVAWPLMRLMHRDPRRRNCVTYGSGFKLSRYSPREVVVPTTSRGNGVTASVRNTIPPAPWRDSPALQALYYLLRRPVHPPMKPPHAIAPGVLLLAACASTPPNEVQLAQYPGHRTRIRTACTGFLRRSAGSGVTTGRNSWVLDRGGIAEHDGAGGGGGRGRRVMGGHGQRHRAHPRWAGAGGP
ncbi:MAG: hypothetical protein R3F17_14975 [Planctomycetota bacterium]